MLGAVLQLRLIRRGKHLQDASNRVVRESGERVDEDSKHNRFEHQSNSWVKGTNPCCLSRASQVCRARELVEEMIISLFCLLTAPNHPSTLKPSGTTIQREFELRLASAGLIVHNSTF